MHRLCILLAVMVVMVGALFAGQDALAKVFAGTGGDDTLVGTDRADSFTGRDGEDRLKGSRGNDRLKGSRGNDKIFPGEDNDKVYGGAGKDLIYARDTDGEDYMDCGGGFDKVETIHSDDETLSNCERSLGPRRDHIYIRLWSDILCGADQATCTKVRNKNRPFDCRGGLVSLRPWDLEATGKGDSLWTQPFPLH